MNTDKAIATLADGRHEKRMVAFSSVLAAIFLTTIKIVVGLWTGSLGILSEAAHSGLDLVAAVVTFLAVRVSDKPADAEHTYGHGKVENLSALIETLLLLATCVWIIYEAIERLFFKDVTVDASPWAFGVMATSIVVDVSRSRALKRVAEKHDSQALEADALHFSTDVWSSVVVIIGLALVKLGESVGSGIPWLSKADAMAALGVALIVIYVGVQLGKRTVDVLLDTAPPGLAQRIETEIGCLPGVLDCSQVRVRRSGAEVFVDMNVSVERSVSIEEAHAIAASIENRVQELVPRSDVVVHIDPLAPPDESLADNIRAIASRHGLRAHGLRVHGIKGELSVELHVEVDDRLNLGQAHELVTAFENDVRAEIGHVVEINTHIEPVGNEKADSQPVESEKELVRRAVKNIAGEVCGGDIHAVTVRWEKGEMSISLHCTLAEDTPITEAHQLSARVEKRLRERMPDLGRVLIHVEPA